MKDAGQAGEAQRKPNIVVRLLAFLVSFGLVLGAIALVAWRDELNLDALKRYLTYRDLARSDSGQAAEFNYASDLTSCYDLTEGGLLIASANSIQLFSKSGVAYINRTVSMENPMISTGGSNAVVCDLGGARLYGYSGQEEVFVYETERDHAILGARLNGAGWLALITEESGYRASVTVYDASFRPVMSRNISSTFVMDAVVSPDGKHLAVVTIGQNGANFESRVTVYPMSDAEAEGSCPLGNETVLSLRWDSTGIWAVGEHSLTLVSAGGETQWTQSYSGQYLKDFSFGEGYAVLLLGRYRSGSVGRLTVIDSGGAETAAINLNEEVLSVSAAGRYIAVLTGRELYIYRQELELYTALENHGEIRRAIQQSDGSAMVVGSSRASLFVPK